MLCPLRLDIEPLSASPLPVALDLIKTHCGVDFNDLDALLQTYLLGAIKAIEDTTHRTLVARQHFWVLQDFPRTPYQRINLPRGKTVAVKKIEYIENGVTQTLTGPSSTPAGTNYQEDLSGEDGGVVMPLMSASWPGVDYFRPAPVTITYTAGWTSAALPTDIVTALLFAVRASLDDGRTDPIKTRANADALESMVSGYRLTRWY